MLSLVAISCQKESVTIRPQNATTQESYSDYVVYFSIEGVTHTIRLHNEAERETFLQNIFGLAKDGCKVVIYSNNCAYPNIAAKESFTFTTSSEKEATDWAEKMLEDGYNVDIEYDSTKGVYICIAWK